MEIKILGSGCSNCVKLEEMTRRVLSELGVPATITKVTDIKEIMSYGVMSTPALVIGNEVKFYGMVPPKARLTEIITTELVKSGE